MLVAAVFLMITVIAHLKVVRPLVLPRLIFPIESVVFGLAAKCSPGSPGWLERFSKTATWHGGSLAGQVAYISPNGDLSHCEHGWRDQAWGEMVTPQLRFRFASATKVLTADAILAAALEQKLALDDPLLGYLPEVNNLADERLRDVTLRQLLNHSAGFDRSRTPDTMFMHAKTPWCPSELSNLEKVTLDFDPGARHAYGNLGYCLLGVVLERVYEEPFRALVERRYALSDYDLKFVDGPYLSDEVQYDFRNSDFYMENYYRYFDFEALSSSAGLTGSALGYAKLINRMLARERHPLREVEADILCSRERFRSCYGHVFNIYQRPDDPLVAYIQSGNLIGASSMVMVDNHGGVLVWVGNGMPRKMQEKMDKIKDIAYGELSEYYTLH
ncbi:serine hydrolase domain-containing protein [Isoalcanivorax pacificus]|nr:serine hydrolase domain-containing protein [Isoalcanivorax pacificus]